MGWTRSQQVHAYTQTHTPPPTYWSYALGERGGAGREAKRKTKKQECYGIFVCVCTQLHLSVYTSLCMLGSLTLCDPMDTDCSPSGSSVHGTLQARILEWVAIFLSRGSSQPQGWNPGLLNRGRILYRWSPQGRPLSPALMLPLHST